MRSAGDLVCVALPAWEGDYRKSTVELMRELARSRRVLYVDYPRTLKDLALQAARGPRDDLRRALGLAPRLRRVDVPEADLHVLTPPPTLPLNGLGPGGAWRRLQALNGRIVGGSIRRAMAALELRDPVVVNALHPTYGVELAGALGESLLVYYCYDELAAAAWNARHGVAAERRLLDLADIVVTSSEELRRSRSRLHPRVVTVPNGVDFEAFHAVCGAPREAGPLRLGYLGSLDGRVDWQLLDGVAAERPDWELWLVGRIADRGAERLARRSNVRLCGPQPPASLPAWVARMDVALVPFVCDDFTRSIYPLKINEYLAAGKPVVRTPFADLPEFDRLVPVARTAAELVAVAEAAAAADDAASRERRAQLARTASWTRRAEAFARILDDATPAEAA